MKKDATSMVLPIGAVETRILSGFTNDKKEIIIPYTFLQIKGGSIQNIREWGDSGLISEKDSLSY